MIWNTLEAIKITSRNKRNNVLDKNIEFFLLRYLKNSLFDQYPVFTSSVLNPVSLCYTDSCGGIYLLCDKWAKKISVLLTEDLACSCNQIICFGIIVNYSDKKLPFFIQLCLLPKKKTEQNLFGWGRSTISINELHIVWYQSFKQNKFVGSTFKKLVKIENCK